MKCAVCGNPGAELTHGFTDIGPALGFLLGRMDWLCDACTGWVKAEYLSREPKPDWSASTLTDELGEAP